MFIYKTDAYNGWLFAKNLFDRTACLVRVLPRFANKHLALENVYNNKATDNSEKPLFSVVKLIHFMHRSGESIEFMHTKLLGELTTNDE